MRERPEIGPDVANLHKNVATRMRKTRGIRKENTHRAGKQRAGCVCLHFPFSFFFSGGHLLCVHTSLFSPPTIYTIYTTYTHSIGHPGAHALFPSSCRCLPWGQPRVRASRGLLSPTWEDNERARDRDAGRQSRQSDSPKTLPLPLPSEASAPSGAGCSGPLSKLHGELGGDAALSTASLKSHPPIVEKVAPREKQIRGLSRLGLGSISQIVSSN